MRRRHWIIVGALAVAVAAAGGAVAATKLDSPSARSQAIINDAAGQLGIPSAKLSDALKKAIDDQIDAEVAAGTITKAQGDALKQRVDSGQMPLLGGFGFGGRHGFGGPGMFGGPAAGPFGFADAAAKYLGVTTDQLRTELQSGKSLADIAKAHGKTADGLVDALVAAAKTKLDQAVKDGKLDSTREQTMLDRLKTFYQALVNRTPPAAGTQNGPRQGFGFGFGFGHRHGFGGRPAQPAAPAAPASL